LQHKLVSGKGDKAAQTTNNHITVPHGKDSNQNKQKLALLRHHHQNITINDQLLAPSNHRIVSTAKKYRYNFTYGAQYFISPSPDFNGDANSSINQLQHDYSTPIDSPTSVMLGTMLAPNYHRRGGSM